MSYIISGMDPPPQPQIPNDQVHYESLRRYGASAYGALP